MNIQKNKDILKKLYLTYGKFPPEKDFVDKFKAEIWEIDGWQVYY